MANPDHHPVTAFFLGISTGLGRLIVLWFTMALSVAIPFIPSTGWATLQLLAYWPIMTIYGLVAWGGFPFPWTLGVVLLPAGIAFGIWGYLNDVAAAVSLWMVATLSLLLTGPALFLTEVSHWVPIGIGIVWTLATVGWFRVTRDG